MLKEIKEQVKLVVEYSQDFSDAQVDKLLNNWLMAKRDFIEIFGGKPIYECPFPMTFHLTEEAKETRVESFVNYIDVNYGNAKLIRFIMNNKEAFFTNIVEKETLGEDGKIVKPGAKIIKSFKHFVNGKNALYDL